MTPRILSLNIRMWTRDCKKSGGHYWKNRYKAIRTYIRNEDPAIICLQEVWFPAGLVLQLGKLGYKKTGFGFTHPIYVRKHFEVKKCRTSYYVTAAVVNYIHVFSVHAHWDSSRFAKAMAWIRRKVEQSSSLAMGKVVCAGDFNTSNIAKIGEALEMSSAREKLGLPAEDTFENYKRPTQSHGEIDHFFYSAGIVPQDYHVYGGIEDFSDHRPIIMTFNINN